MNIPAENVDIFSVRDHQTLARTIDVRYSAHGSPFYRQTRMDGLLSLDILEVVRSVAITFCLHTSSYQTRVLYL